MDSETARNADILVSRAVVAQKAGDKVKAAELFIRSAMEDQTHCNALLEFARAMVLAEEREIAKVTLDAFLGFQPDHDAASRLMALVLMDTGDLEGSRLILTRQLAKSPDDIGLLLNLYNVCQYLGSIDDARAYAELAVASHPENTQAHYYLSLVTDYKKGHKHVDVMKGLFERLGKDDPQRIHLGFALYRAQEVAQDYENAFHALSEANRIQRLVWPYDVRTDLMQAEGLISAFSPQRVGTLLGGGIRGVSPIFIVGMPRSGSTLTEQILASHPDVHGGGEIEYSPRLITANFMVEQAGTMLPDISGMTPARIRDAGLKMAKTYMGFANGMRRVADKMPFNFLWLGFIKLILPDAKFIHIQRAPAATLLANYAALFNTDSLRYLYDIKDIAHYIVMQERLMGHWKALFPGAIHELSYEALTADQENETRKLLAYCDLSWDPACLDFHKTERVVSTSSSAQVRKALYSGVDRKTAHYARELEPGLKILREAGLID